MGMGTQSVTSDREGKQLRESKKGRRKQRKMSQVQRLYETCKKVFANCGPGIIPSSANVELLKSAVDSMTESDVGLKPNMPFFSTNDSVGRPRITYLQVYECDKFSIGIFCLPPSGVIPLHNHPGMTVFSKLLFGTMHIKSYDWVDNGLPGTIMDKNLSNILEIKTTRGKTVGNAAGPASLRLARLKVNSEFTAPNTSILYPADGGNMHCFTASTPCAVLDVLGPPYSAPDGRHCAYFLELPLSKFPGNPDCLDAVKSSVNGLSLSEKESEDCAWLQETEKPKDLAIVGALYRGPKIVRK